MSRGGAPGAAGQFVEIVFPDKERGPMSENAWGDRTVGAVVTENYLASAVFERFGIDFCCGGNRSIRSACAEAGVELAEVLRSLDALNSAPAEDPSARAATWELDALAQHIVEVHHGYVRDSLPGLREISSKLARVHGRRHAELIEIRDLVVALSTEMERHMKEEEDVLFPRIAELKAGRGSADPLKPVREATLPLEDDHTRAGSLMRRIRDLSNDFSPPPDACATYRATYARLEAFEEDLHRHIHLENNILFPRAVALESDLTGGGVGR